MTVNITKPAKNLIEELSSLRAKIKLSEQEVFWFDGDTITTDFTLQHGWKPKFVYVNGLLFREGEFEDYTVLYDGFKYTIQFLVAPSVVDIGIISQRDI